MIWALLQERLKDLSSGGSSCSVTDTSTAAEGELQACCCLLCSFSAGDRAREGMGALAAAKQLPEEPVGAVTARLCRAWRHFGPPKTPFNCATSFKQEILQFEKSYEVQTGECLLATQQLRGGSAGCCWVAHRNGVGQSSSATGCSQTHSTNY